MVPTQLPPCTACRKTDYNVQSGIHVCSNCNVQSQGINYINSTNIEKDDDNASEVQDRKFTSWEVYNLILKGSLNEIIQLGAPDEVKIVALQLWAQYLQKSGAAFISKDEKKYPKLPAGFKNKDVRILYGVKNLRKKIAGDLYPSKYNRKKRANGSESGYSNSSKKSVVSVSKWMRKKRKLAKYSNDAPITETESLRTIESKSDNKNRKSVVLNFTTNAEKRLCQMLTTAANCAHADDDKKDQIRRKNNVRQYFYNKSKKAGKKDSLTMSTIMSIIRISLMMIGHNNIQLSDLLRWIREGRLSMSRPELFLPKDQNVGPIPFNAQRFGLQNDLFNTVKCLGIKYIQPPNLYKLVKKYCKELQLPKKFVKEVHSVMLAHPPSMDYISSVKSNFPDYECRAIAYIVFVAKLLFGLNDYCEFKYSDLASNVNKYYEENDIKKRKLFSWREWTRYIECRNAVLSKFSTVQNEKYYDSRLCNEYNFVNYWNRASPLIVVNSQRVDKTLQSMSKVMSKLGRNENNEFPMTAIYRTDDLSHILNTLGHLVPKSSAKILSKDFSKHSILYLKDDGRCREACSDCGFDLEFTSSQLSFKRYKKKKQPLISLTKTQVLPAHVIFTVVLQDNHQDIADSSSRKLSKHKCETEKIERDSTDYFSIPTNNDSAEMTFPRFEYWFFHDIYRNITNEEFQNMSDLFPNSFLWLLKLCSTTVEIHMKDIYCELVNIEVTLYQKYMDKKYKVEGWRTNLDEW